MRAALAAGTEHLPVGDPASGAVALGPMIGAGQVAQALAQVCDKCNDLVSRYGGEEFAVIFPGEDATAVAYVQLRAGARTVYGVGLDPNIVTASLRAVVSAVNRAQR